MTASSIAQRLKVLYVVPATKNYAGIERVVDEVASELAVRYASTLDVHVVFLSYFKNYTVGERPYHKLQEAPKTRRDVLRTARRVVAAHDYDLVIVPQVEVVVMFWTACVGLSRRFAVHLHGNPTRERSHIRAKILFEMYRRLVSRRIAAVFGTSPRQLTEFKKLYPSRLPHLWLPNPVRRFDLDLSARPATAGPVTFVSVARFSYQKGQDLLVEAFARLYQVRKNVKLRVVGYGPEEADIRRQISRLGLDEVVSIEHFPDSPQVPLATSDVYICTSRWEGWSLAICEALRFGLPVISTDCEFGPSDILTDPRLGRLVPISQADELTQVMMHYCDHLAEERQHAEFRRGYVERFSVERVVQIHAEAIARVVAGGPKTLPSRLAPFLQLTRVKARSGA